MSAPRGYSSQEKEDRLSAQFQTVEPVRELQFGSSVVSHQYVYEVATDAVEAGTTAAVLVATGHSALKGDVVRITSGALAGYEAKVWAVAANSITLAETLPAAPGASDAIQILRHKYPTVEATGEVKVSGVFAEVATAASGDPLPAVLKVAGGYDGSVVTVLKTDAAGELQVDVLSSALPSGAATEATLATLATEATVATLATEATASTLATSAIQTDGSQKTQIVDGSGNVIGSTGNALDVNLKSPITVDVSLSEANDSVAVFGFDGAANRALKTDAAGELQIDVLSSALPSGAATEATVATLATEATLSTIDADTSALAGCVAGTEVQVDVVSSALPSGAATEATLVTLATEATLSTIDADTSLLAGCVAGTEVQVDVVSSALPTGAATEATLASLDGKVTTCNTGAVTISTALPAGTATIGKVDVNTLSVVDLIDGDILDTSSTNIPGSASSPVEIVASTAAAIQKLQILDTTGAFIGLYTGAVASEVLQLVIGPGSDQTIEHSIPASTRVSLKRLDSTTAVSSGIVAINFIG